MKYLSFLLLFSASVHASNYAFECRSEDLNPNPNSDRRITLRFTEDLKLFEYVDSDSLFRRNHWGYFFSTRGPTHYRYNFMGLETQEGELIGNFIHERRRPLLDGFYDFDVAGIFDKRISLYCKAMA